MKKIHQAVIVLFLLVLVNSANALTVKQYEDRILKNGTKEGQQSRKMYISGLSDGILGSNLLSKQNFGKKLFCQPEITLNFENYKEILEETIKKKREMILTSGDKHKLKTLEESPIGMIMLMGLRDTFPCPK